MLEFRKLLVGDEGRRSFLELHGGEIDAKLDPSLSNGTEPARSGTECLEVGSTQSLLSGQKRSFIA